MRIYHHSFVMPLVPVSSWLAVAALIFGACGEKSKLLAPGDVIDRGPLIPLVVGNTWIGSRTVEDDDGNITNLDPLQYVVVGDTIVDGKKSVLFYTEIGGFPIRKAIVTIESDGVYGRELGEDESALWFQFPTRKGSEFASDYFQGFPDEIVVTSVNELVETPLGSFRCYHYERQTRDSNDSQYSVYISTGVGIVKQVLRIVDPFGSRTTITYLVSNITLHDEPDPDMLEKRFFYEDNSMTSSDSKLRDLDQIPVIPQTLETQNVSIAFSYFQDPLIR